MSRDVVCRAVEVFLLCSLHQLTLTCKMPEPLSPGRSGSQHCGQDADLPALIAGQRNPQLYQ